MYQEYANNARPARKGRNSSLFFSIRYTCSFLLFIIIFDYPLTLRKMRCQRNSRSVIDFNCSSEPFQYFLLRHEIRNSNANLRGKMSFLKKPVSLLAIILGYLRRRAASKLISENYNLGSSARTNELDAHILEISSCGH